MRDILPELLNAVEEAYQVNIEQDETVKRLLNELKSGAADYEKASGYAERLGDALAKAFQAQISADTLPDGKMYYNIANRLVNATFQDNYSRIASYCKETQESLNKAAGIGLKAQVPEFNQDRADGIIERLSEAENYEDVSWILGEPVTNFAMAIVDDYIKANADFQYKSGLSPKIVRTTNGKCCDWCDRLAGTYDYKDVKNTGNDVFRRHRHCRCKVIYDPADGKKVKDVWTKKEEDSELETNPEEKEAYIQLSKEEGPKRAREAKSLASLKKYLNEAYGIEMDNSVLDMNLESVRDAIDGMESVIEEFPEISQNIKTVELGETGVMSCSTRKITLNPSYFEKPGALDEAIKNSVESGWWPKNTSIASIGAHEAGHAVNWELILRDTSYEYDFQRTIDWNDEQTAKSIVSQACKNVKSSQPKGKKKTYEEIRQAQSRYGATKPAEAIAESFADLYANGESASPLSKEIIKIIKQRYKGE